MKHWDSAGAEKKFIKKDPNITKDNGVGAADTETH
jgi:hypothetical protein